MIFDKPAYPVLDKAPHFWKTGAMALPPPRVLRKTRAIHHAGQPTRSLLYGAQFLTSAPPTLVSGLAPQRSVIPTATTQVCRSHCQDITSVSM